MWLAFAGLSAVCFGLRGILYQWTSQKPIDRNLMLLGVYLSGTVVTLTANAFVGQAWSKGMMMGISMGIFSFIANTAMYKGFAVGKASIVAVFTALPAGVVVVVGYLLWSEKLNFGQMGAFVIILCGIILLRYSKDLSLSNLKGIQWAILALFGFAFTDLSSKQSILWSGQALPTLSVMFATGALLVFIVWLSLGSGKKKAETFSPAKRVNKVMVEMINETAIAAAAKMSKETADETVCETVNDTSNEMDNKLTVKLWSKRRTVLWGMVVGLTNCCGMILLMPAFKLGITGLVSAVVATNVLLILLFARIYLQETFSRLEVLGMALAITGVILLRVLG